MYSNISVTLTLTIMLGLGLRVRRAMMWQKAAVNKTLKVLLSQPNMAGPAEPISCKDQG